MGTLVAGVAALLLFTWRQLATDHPLLDLRVFQYNMFSLTSVIGIAVTMVMFADMLLLPLYLQHARGYSAVESGLLLMPGVLLMGFLMPVAGKWFDRFGAKWLAIVGLFITIVTTILFTNLTDTTSYIYLLVVSTMRRMGMALLLMPIQTAGLNQLPARLSTHGTAISNTIRQVAGAVGTSLLVTVMTNRTQLHFEEMKASGGTVLDASIQGINDAYLVLTGIGIVGLLLSFYIKPLSRASDDMKVKVRVHEV